jgi:hypothetical protein
MKIVEFFLIIWGKWSENGIFDKLEPEPERELELHKNGPALQHWKKVSLIKTNYQLSFLFT